VTDVVNDSPNEVHDLETQQEFDEAQKLDDNYAGNADIRSRAQRVVSGCLTQVDAYYMRLASNWRQLDSLYNLESLSESARGFGVHLGTPFAGVEEFAAKIKDTIFTGREFVNGTPDDRDNGEKAEMAVALVQEQILQEMKLEIGAMPMLRTAGIFGASIQKCVPNSKVIRKFTRKRTARPTADGGHRYIFQDPEEVEHTLTNYERLPVAPQDFRIPPTAGSVDDAAWCGDYSYPNEKELQDCVDRGLYSKEHVDNVISKDESDQTRRGAAGAIINDRLIGRGDQPDSGPHMSQYARFEWYGLFDLHNTGDFRECVITMLMPSNGADTGIHKHTEGQVVRITTNPYDHQLKPYAAFRPTERENEFWTMGPCEVMANNSVFEDEMAQLSLMTAYQECSPLIEIGEASGVDPADLDGFLPGSHYEAEVTGEVSYLTSPQRSGIGLQMAEYFANRGQAAIGLGQPQNAPRSAAAGIMTDAQQLDLRLSPWVDAYERQMIARLAEFAHAYNRQFMTVERKVKLMGIPGLRVEDIRTVSPVDVDVDIRFEPIVGRRLRLESMQVQGLMNMLDRMMADNMQSMQTGKGEKWDTSMVITKILERGFQFTDDSIKVAGSDPSELPTPQEEHYAYSLGERPEPKRGENTMVHLQQHIQFVQGGGTAEWRPEYRQAFIDHIYETINDMSREAMNAAPQLGQMLQELMGQVPGESTRPGMNDDQGSRGFSMPTTGPGNSPMFRNPQATPQASAGMSMSPNMGAQ